MIWIILAAGLGAANFIVVVLLFRRLRRDLGRQLRDMRAEHNSESILRALQGTPETTEQQETLQAANGSWRASGPSYGSPEPVRRKKHLGLFLGGGAVAAFAVTAGQAARVTWQLYRGHAMATAAGAAVAATGTAFLLVYAPWQGDGQDPPSSAPTAGPTASYTQSPPSGPTRSATPSQSPNGPQPGESASPTRIVAGLATPMGSTLLVPIGERREPTPSTSQPPEIPVPSSSVLPGTPTPEPTPPAKPPPALPPADQLPGPTATSSPCLGVGLTPVLDVDACLSGGGGD